MRAQVSQHEEQLERKLDQAEAGLRLCESDLDRYRQAIERDQEPAVRRLHLELLTQGAEVSLFDLKFALGAAGVRVVAWGERGG